MLPPTGSRVLFGSTAGGHRNAMESAHYRTSTQTATVANVVVTDLYRTDPYRRQGRGRELGVVRHVLTEGDRRVFGGEEESEEGRFAIKSPRTMLPVPGFI